MSEHTKGALEFSSAGHGSKGGITVDEFFIRRPEDDVAVAAEIIDPETGAPSEANARRLAACWNACQNITTAAIESGSLNLFQLQVDRMVLTQQRDELLAAANTVLKGLNERIYAAVESRSATPVFDGIAALHSAITKATAHPEILELTMSDWTKCSDELPSGPSYVLAYGTSSATEEPSVIVAWFNHGHWLEANNGDYIDGGYGNDYPANVTHWQPLPAPPAE